jgi:tetratricopeptide (TPR) repeat protein
MTRAFSRPRRFALTAIALVLAAVAFRSQLAQALVVRGDDLTYKGRSADALTHYGRAVWLDPNSSLAVDRYVFASMQRHSMNAIRSGISTATGFLTRNPHDAAVLRDRALCYLVQQRYAAARQDFEHAASASSDPRDYVFAGWAALHTRDAAGARRLWRRALALDERFLPAKIALAEHAK